MTEKSTTSDGGNRRSFADYSQLGVRGSWWLHGTARLVFSAKGDQHSEASCRKLHHTLQGKMDPPSAGTLTRAQRLVKCSLPDNLSKHLFQTRNALASYGVRRLLIVAQQILVPIPSQNRGPPKSRAVPGSTSACVLMLTVVAAQMRKLKHSGHLHHSCALFLAVIRISSYLFLYRPSYSLLGGQKEAKSCRQAHCMAPASSNYSLGTQGLPTFASLSWCQLLLVRCQLSPQRTRAITGRPAATPESVRRRSFSTLSL